MAIQKTGSILVMLAVSLAQPTIAAPWLPPQGLVEVLPLAVTADGLAGTGGERLLAELADVQFVAVGEDHGFAGPPMLAAALGKELERVKGPPLYHVVEVDLTPLGMSQAFCARMAYLGSIAWSMSSHPLCHS